MTKPWASKASSLVAWYAKDHGKPFSFRPGVCVLTIFFMVELEIGREVMRLRRLGLVLLFPMCLITGLLMLTVQRTEVYLHLTLLPDTVANRRSSRSPFLPRCDLFRVRLAVQNTWMQMRLFGPPG